MGGGRFVEAAAASDRVAAAPEGGAAAAAAAAEPSIFTAFCMFRIDERLLPLAPLPALDALAATTHAASELQSASLKSTRFYNSEWVLGGG